MRWIENGAAFEFEPMDSCQTNKCPVLRKWQEGTVTEIRIANDCSHTHQMICQLKCQADDECKFFLAFKRLYKAPAKQLLPRKAGTQDSLFIHGRGV